ncbi:hypothetical protein HJC23_008586 [Cyclotella cryptica]|uniref:Choline transporter-like protein n=1 Tax=Cyclotella cryptica TaxID=29204 RepID=A0ABD3Q9H9_9STRA|eukprot:CCRYP_007940-RB/>CCRYP_007940-RB protein AED:0.16 eAED:0.16 QI:1405/1/0.92/1/0.38/0.28/14/2168/751
MVGPIFAWRKNGSGDMELQLPENKVPNHPDNEQLAKRCSDDDFSPLDSGRRCTDVLFLLLIICSWVAMTGLGLASMGVIKSEYIKHGDPNRLVNGLDYHGNVCGVTNFVTPGGEDVINLPMAYPMPSGFFVCVESCPSTNNFDKFICEYEIQHDIDATLSAAADIGGSGVVESNNASKSIYLFYTGQKQCMPLIESTSFLGYCIPNLPLNDVLLSTNGTSNQSDVGSSPLTQEKDDAISNNATIINGTTAYNNASISVSVTAEKKATSRSDVFDMVMADVHTVRYVIFTFGCGVAVTLGIFFLIIIQLPGLLSLLVWSMIIAVDVGLVAAGYYTKGVSATWEASGRPGNEALALYYGSYALYGLAGVWCLVMLFLRKRILLAIACVKEASRAISAMPLMTVFPAAQVLSLFAFTVVWGIYMAYLASSGEIKASCMCPIFDQGFAGVVDAKVTPAPTPADTAMASNSLGSDSCGEGCFVYKELTYSTNTKYAGLYMIFVWFWTSQFIVAVGQLVVAVSVSKWYFSRDRSRVGNSTFVKSIFLVSRYHLGTAAFGALVIAIIKTIRAVLSYIQKRAAKSKIRLAVILLKVLQCLIWCLEKCLKFINKQAYIQTAIFSYSFCKAARTGFFLILRNALRISAVSIVSQVVLFIGKVFITVVSTVSGYYYLQIHFGDQLNSLMAPTLLIAICSYAVSEMFDEVFGMAISTILQCFVTDEEIFEPNKRYSPSSLSGTLDATQQKYDNKKNSSIGIDQ